MDINDTLKAIFVDTVRAEDEQRRLYIDWLYGKKGIALEIMPGVLAINTDDGMEIKRFG